MEPLGSVLALGFLLGMRHATDPDHVVAVGTIVCRERTLRAAAPVGVLWGLGHTVTIVVVGGAIILFGLVVPPRLGLSMELAVGLMLVALGVWNLAALLREGRAGRAHPHVHRHDHGHDHGGTAGPLVALDDRLGRLGRLGAYRLVRPLVVGVVHGLAGSAAVALLVLGTIRDPAWAACYLLIFGLGTIAGMLVITTTMAVPFVYFARRFERLHRALSLGSSAVSVAFGLFLVYDLGFVHGLFTSHPRWTPE